MVGAMVHRGESVGVCIGAEWSDGEHSGVHPATHAKSVAEALSSQRGSVLGSSQPAQAEV